MKNNKTILGIAILSLLFTFGCGSTSYLGGWNFTVTELPDGTITGLLTISETESGYNCNVLFTDSYDDFDMVSCNIAENSLSGHYFDETGSKIEISGTFEEDKLTGFVNIEGQDFPLQLVKAEE